LATDPNKQARIVEARMQLRRRFEAKFGATPQRGSGGALGSGPPNRHGMPKLPIGQIETHKWPVLDLGNQPSITREAWKLAVDGACETPYELSWKAFLALEQVRDTSDFHCVTTWSLMDVEWVGVRFSDLAALAMPSADASHVLCHAYDGYTTNLPLSEALKPDVLLVHQVNGGPLPVEHGGPVRVITPQLYAWKGAKWISRIEFLIGDRPGFWEERGYSNSARPWENDRYG
jgi:DMSO/TMAO reductase YedYZ molybdopterin-dependent catalytic subunit